MTFHPGIMALLLGSVLTSSMLCYSGYYALSILRRWDLHSGSELQLGLERRTYFISTVMSYVLGFQLLSLVLFIYTTDALSPLFVGAMCAAGSLNVNAFGYTAVILKLVNFLLASLWLIVNYADNQAYDYPLIKAKYGLLLAITPLLIAEASVQGAYLLDLKPNIITSCCGTLFTGDADNVMAGLIDLPRALSESVFCMSAAVTLAVGLYFYLKGGGAYIFSISSLLMFLISIVALISFISVYFYELPTHHCPFCILHQEYGFIGYPIYVTLLVGVVSGVGVGCIMPFRKIASLGQILPRLQRKLALTSVLSYSAFLAIVAFGILSSHLSLAAY